MIKDSTIGRDKLIPSAIQRKLYFINEIVEWQLTQYIWTGCTKVRLRDMIMSHATELIRQIIRKQNLHAIYPGQDESSFYDLLQTAWVQIERTLYKYRSRPHCRNCFNPDRPADSILYEPAAIEYGIKTLDEVILMHPSCPKCGMKFENGPIVEPVQGLYAGSETVLYRGMSKVFNMWCIAPDSMLLSSSGIETIQNVVNDEIKHVYGLYGFTNVNGYLEKPEQDCIILQTAYGYSITTSPEHKLYTNSNGRIDWKQTKDIEEGDLVAIQYDQQVFFNEDKIDIQLNRGGDWNPPHIMNEELAYIIGLFIAEGSYSYGKLVIYNVDEEIINILVNNKLGLNFINEPKYDRVSLCNVRFIEFLIKLGFGEKTSAETKFIPRKMLKCSKQVISAMLRGMFDGDGHSSISDGTVGYTSTSKFLISQLRVLLLNYGILTKLSKDNRNFRTFNKGDKIYNSALKGSQQLLISNYYSLRFYEDIGFELSRKQSNKNNLIINDSEHHDGELRMHGLNDKFRSLYNKYGCGILGYDSIRKVLKSKYCTLGTAISKLSSWSDYENDEDFKFILDRINERQDIVNKLVWLPIACKKPVRSDLCEISVESNDHSYIANGFVSHNSQIARTVILAHIKKEGRDRKNSGSYINHLGNKHKPLSGIMERMLLEMREMNQYDKNHLRIIESLEYLITTDDKPHDGLIGKLVNHSGLSRQIVTNFLRVIKLRSFDMTDSLVNRTVEPKTDGRKGNNNECDEE